MPSEADESLAAVHDVGRVPPSAPNLRVDVQSREILNVSPDCVGVMWTPLKTPECGTIFRNCAAEKRIILEVFEHHRPLILINWG